MGHWENTNLNKEQCMYAATDAYVSIYLKSIICCCTSREVFTLGPRRVMARVAGWQGRCILFQIFILFFRVYL